MAEEQDIDQLRREAARQRDAINRDLENVGDRVSPGRIVERRRAVVVGRLSDARSSVFGTSDRARGAAGDSGLDSETNLRDQAGDAVDRLKEKTPDSVGDFAHGNPLAAGLIGLGVGLLAATLIPSTREEQRMADRAQDTLNAVAGDLGQAGREAAEKVKPAAQEAVAQVKESAQESAQNVQSEAKGAAEDVRSKAEDKKDQIN